jgi:protein-S-isoprenylcysteine O-methyltransferase Ste14
MTAENRQQAPDIADSAEMQSNINRRMIQVLFQVLIQAVAMFVAAGTLRWWEAWAFLGMYLALIAVNGWFMLRFQRETVAERGRGSASENMKTWDKVVGLVAVLFYFVGIFVVAGLDERFTWTDHMPLTVQIAAFVIWALGSGLFGWAMYTNAFFSSVVRIQDDRGHQVCDSGPYRFVRHPGYVGACLQSLATPLMLGSWWALIPSALAVLFFAFRTAMEDRTLQDELDGYREYAGRVRYRLLPGVW